MLNQLRNSIRGPIGIVAVIVIAIAVSVTFSPESLRIFGDPSVARVGDQAVSVREMSRAFDRAIDFWSRQTGERLTAEEARAQGLHRHVYGELIATKLLDAKARELKLGVNDERLFAYLESVPAFQDPVTGEFSRQQYLFYVRQQRLSIDELETDITDELRRDQLLSALRLGLRPPALLAEVEVRFAREERTATIASIPADALGETAPPTEDQLAAYFAENRSRYAAPERRALTFVIERVEDRALDVEVFEEDLRLEYDARRDEYETAERRDLVGLIASDADTALQAAARLRAGEEPSAIAQALGLPEPDTYEDAVEGDVFDPAAAAAAFALEVGAVSDPVEGALSWSVWKALSVTPGGATSFEDVREQIRDEIAGAEARAFLDEGYQIFVDARLNGAPLANAAADAGFVTFSVRPVDARARDAGGRAADLLLSYPEILQTAFRLEEGDTSDAEELGPDGLFAVRVDAVTPRRELELAEARDQAAQDWIARERGRALDSIADSVRDLLAAGQDPQATYPFVEVRTIELSRLQAAPADVPGSVVNELFATTRGGVALGATPDGGRLVGRLDAIEPVDAMDGAELEGLRASLTPALQGDVEAFALAAYQNEFDVRLNEQQLARAVGDITQ